jgi:hypothetical protein
MDQRGYRRVFVEAHGPWPHTCVFCGEEVDLGGAWLSSSYAIVHHVDGDRSNNAAENLAPAHHGCHLSHHHTGKVMSAEARAKIGAWQKGRPKSPAQRAKMSAAQLGREVSPETRAKLSAANTGWKPSANQRAKMREAQAIRRRRERDQGVGL